VWTNGYGRVIAIKSVTILSLSPIHTTIVHILVFNVDHRLYIVSRYPLNYRLFFQDYIIESARRVNRIHFVHCLLPHADAGLGIAPSTTVDDSTNENNALINVPLLRQQIRAIQLVDSVRANKRGL
jgi:hypothetical protein